MGLVYFFVLVVVLGYKALTRWILRSSGGGDQRHRREKYLHYAEREREAHLPWQQMRLITEYWQRSLFFSSDHQTKVLQEQVGMAWFGIGSSEKGSRCEWTTKSETMKTTLRRCSISLCFGILVVQSSLIQPHLCRSMISLWTRFLV